MSRPTRSDPGGRAYLDLQNIARKSGRGTQELLVMYALERFLARLAASEHRGTFVLKGGMLLAALNARRATVDADLLATHLANDEATVLARVQDIASTVLNADDGVRYDLRTARARSIRDGDHYAGVRITMDAHVARAAVKLQLDINFGDPITPAPIQISYPPLRPDYPPVQVLGYPLATVLAEKLATAIDLGASNTRVRDYADIWTLTRIHTIDAVQLQSALQATAQYRGIQLQPLSDVIEDIAAARQNTYDAYRRRVTDDVNSLPEKFEDVVAAVIRFADPVIADPLAESIAWHPLHSRWQKTSDSASADS